MIFMFDVLGNLAYDVGIYIAVGYCFLFLTENLTVQFIAGNNSLSN